MAWGFGRRGVMRLRAWCSASPRRRCAHTRAGASFGVRWVERSRLDVESVRRDARRRRRRSGECRLVCARVSPPGRRVAGAGRGRLLRLWHADRVPRPF